MKIAIFVHDFTYEIGHSKAMIEYLRALGPNHVSEIQLVVLKHSPIDEIFPTFKGKIKVIKLPGHNLKPALFKNIFFQVLTSFIANSMPKDVIKIGIGTACLNVDVTNIQFIHSQWENKYFSSQKLNLFSKFYKHLLFGYERWCEKILFKKHGIKFLVIAQFLKDYLISKYNIAENQVAVAYSHANTDYFQISSLTRPELLENLSQKYGVLSKLDLNKPIALFVGAFQRKGLMRLLEQLSMEQSQLQLIVVGKSESHQSIVFPQGLNIFHVPFTKELPLFYSLADAFIFPTLYEPFGLVIAEAALMGMQVLVTKEEVGASEVLQGLEGIFIFSQEDRIPTEKVEKISMEQRKIWREQRISKLKDHDWQKAADKLKNLIQKS